MPQEHYVLRCFSCDTFQAHIVKKAKKWECKMCGEKQSLKRNYGRGSAKECRQQVMKLNQLRLIDPSHSKETEGVIFDDNDLIGHELKEEPEPNKPFTSKWAKYLDEPVMNSESDDDSSTDISVGSEIRKKENKKKRLIKMPDDSEEVRGHFRKNKKICSDMYVNKASSPINSQLFSTTFGNMNFEACKSDKPTEVKYDTEAESKIKFNKYSKYLDEDCKEEIQNGSVHASNIFDSDPNYLDDLLSLE